MKSDDDIAAWNKLWKAESAKVLVCILFVLLLAFDAAVFHSHYHTRQSPTLVTDQQQIHSELVKSTVWNQSFQGVSWRIDVPTASKASVAAAAVEKKEENKSGADAVDAAAAGEPVALVQIKVCLIPAFFLLLLFFYLILPRSRSPTVHARAHAHRPRPHAERRQGPVGAAAAQLQCFV